MYSNCTNIVLLSLLNSSWSFLEVTCLGIQCWNTFLICFLQKAIIQGAHGICGQKKLIHSGGSFQRESSCKFVMFCWVKFPVWRNIKDGWEYELVWLTVVTRSHCHIYNVTMLSDNVTCLVDGERWHQTTTGLQWRGLGKYWNIP